MKRPRWILAAGFWLLLPILLGGVLFGGTARASAVILTAGSGQGLAGQTVDIGISTGYLTGLGVNSYQFSLAYTPQYLTAINVLEDSTLTGAAGWSLPQFSVANGVITLSAAGATTLSGSGVLVRIRFRISPAALNGGYASLTWQNILLNEGAPTTTGVNGQIQISPTPGIQVSPDQGVVARGESMQFQVYGHNGSVTPPVTWGTTKPNVATISSSGLLTGLLAGAVRVFAVDHAGLTDTTNNVILVRGMRLTVATDTAYVGTLGQVPITVTDLGGLGIHSGQVTIAYDSTYISFHGATAGSMLAGYQFSAAARNGLATISFAGTGIVSGSGTLCTLSFLAGHARTGYTSLRVAGAAFNETLPAVSTDGTFLVRTLGNIAVYPSTVTLLAGELQQFVAYGDYSGPLAWSTLDSTVATIDSGTGLLVAVAGGVTQVRARDIHGVTGLNTSVSVYDFQLNPPPVIWAVPGKPVHVPLYADRDVGGLHILSVQCTLAVNDTALTQAGVDSAGLVSVWGKPQGHGGKESVSFSAAGTFPLAHGTIPPVASFGFTVAPGFPVISDRYLTLPTVLLNEGRPRAQAGSGRLHVVGPLTAFALSSPADLDTMLLTLQPTMAWHPSRTTDPADSVLYTLYWSKHSDFTQSDSALASAGGLDTTYTFSPLDSLRVLQLYYWKVRAHDRHGLVQWSDPSVGWRFRVGPPVPVGLEVSAAAGEDGIVISWIVPSDLGGQGYRVYRKTDQTEWISVSPILPGGSGTMRFTDVQVVPGVTYQYEVEVWGVNGPVGRWGPVSATLSPVTALSLKLEPNPGRGSLVMNLGLPRSSDAVVRVIDAGGREIAQRTFFALSAGRHQIAWTPGMEAGTRLASGAYWIRLETLTGRRTVRWVVIR